MNNTKNNLQQRVVGYKVAREFNAAELAKIAGGIATGGYGDSEGGGNTCIHCNPPYDWSTVGNGTCIDKCN